MNYLKRITRAIQKRLIYKPLEKMWMIYASRRNRNKKIIPIKSEH